MELLGDLTLITIRFLLPFPSLKLKKIRKTSELNSYVPNPNELVTLPLRAKNYI